MRIDSRSGSSADISSATCCARRQLARAALMLRLVGHAPARICQPYAACRSPAASQVLGDQGGVLLEPSTDQDVRSRPPRADATLRDPT